MLRFGEGLFMNKSSDNTKAAQKIFKTLCAAVDSLQLKCERNDERLCVDVDFDDGGIRFKVRLLVDADGKTVKASARMPFVAPQGRRDNIALALCTANVHLYDGCFEFNYFTGEMAFRVALEFVNSDIGKDAFVYLLKVAVETIDCYDEKLLFLTRNDMSAKQIVEFMS